MNVKREQALAQFIDTFGVDSAAEIVMYVLSPKRDTMLLARLTKHLSKAEDTINKRHELNFRKKYGDTSWFNAKASSKR